MNFKSVAGALALSAVMPAMAGTTCGNTFSLGTLGADDSALYWRAFFNPQSFDDCFTFTLAALSDTSVISTEWDLSFKLNINIDSVSLSGGSLAGAQALTPNDINGFTFNSLLAGDYVLAVAGNVVDTGSIWPSFGVGYGVAVATQAPSTVSPVPEPQTLAMFTLGLAVVAWGARRRA